MLHAQRGMFPPHGRKIKSMCGLGFDDQSQFWNIITKEKRGKRCKNCLRAIRKNARRFDRNGNWK